MGRLEQLLQRPPQPHRLQVSCQPLSAAGAINWRNCAAHAALDLLSITLHRICRHYYVQDHAHVRNGRYVPDRKCDFKFGQSIPVYHHNVGRTFQVGSDLCASFDMWVGHHGGHHHTAACLDMGVEHPCHHSCHAKHTGYSGERGERAPAVWLLCAPWL